jgi:SPP1 family phage portal protein
MTPDEIIQQTKKQWIYNQDHKDRLELYKEYESYWDGTFADGDEKTNRLIPERIHKALQSDFKVISNYAKTVVNKAVGYLTGEPIAIEVKPDYMGISEEDKENRKKAKDFAAEAERLLYSIYRKNSFLQKNIVKLVRIQGKKGDVFVKCYLDRKDKENPIKLAVLRPDIVFIKFKDDVFDAHEHIAIIYETRDAQNNVLKYAQVWWPDVVREYNMGVNQTQWKQVGSDYVNEIGVIPIVHIKNMEDETPWGESDIEVIKTLVDASCKVCTDLMVNADYQAFQRVLITGHSEESSYLGASDINTPAPKKASTGPGTMSYIPEPDSKVYVVEPANPEGLIKIIDALAQEIATHARVPKISLSRTDGAGAASSLSLRIHYQPLDEKCNEKAMLISSGLQEINKIVFLYHALLTPTEKYSGLETEIRFTKSLPVDRLEESQILDTELRNKIKSRETAMQETGVDDVEEEKARIAEDTAADQTDLYGQRLNTDIEKMIGGGTGA